MEVLNSLYNAKIEELKAYDSAIRKSHEEATQIHADILTFRKNHSEATKEDLADMFVAFKKSFIKRNVLQDISRMTVAEFASLKIVIDVTGTKVKATDEEFEKVVLGIINGESKPYMVEKGELVQVVKGFEEKIFTQVESDTRTPEQLESLFNTPELTPQ